MTLLLGGLLAAGVAMNAESLSVHVPFPFSAGGKTLPAGEYTMTSPMDRVLLIQGASPEASVAVMTASAEVGGKTGAVFSQAAGKNVLAKVAFLNESVLVVSPERRIASVPQPAAASALAARR